MQKAFKDLSLSLSRADSGPHQPAEDDSSQVDLAGEAEEPKALASEPWYVFIAKTVFSMAHSIAQGLRGKTLVPYYCEWCSTPAEPTCGLAYIDAAWKFSDKAPYLERATGAERRKMYVGIPHKLFQWRGDPVLAAAKQRVEEFYSQTFWANAHAHKVCMAALALASRGINVDCVFFMLGPGGVGLSLTTNHLDAMLGSGNHKFFDPQALPVVNKMSMVRIWLFENRWFASQ